MTDNIDIKPTGDINLPDQPGRKVDSSEETDADSGGGFSFVFYDQLGRHGKKKKDEKKEIPPLTSDSPVDIKLSSAKSTEENQENQSKETESKEEEEKKKDENGKGSDGHINITV
jgi:hypothetical protein